MFSTEMGGPHKKKKPGYKKTLSKADAFQMAIDYLDVIDDFVYLKSYLK